MARSRRGEVPPRRWILGILLLSVSILTALSLPGPGWGSMTGPFGRFWVVLWAETFGVPGLWLLSAVGAAWGIGLLVRWRRGFLWGLGLTSAPFIITWDAFFGVLFPVRSELLFQGQLASRLQSGIRAFFGPDVPVQHGFALGALALTSTVLLVRWGLPPIARERLWGGIVEGVRGIGVGLAWSGRMLARSGGWIVTGVVRAARPLAAGLTSWIREHRPRRAVFPPERAEDPPRPVQGALIVHEEEEEDAPIEVRAPSRADRPRRLPAEDAEPVFPNEGLMAQAPPPETRPAKRKAPPPKVPRGADPVAPAHLLEAHREGGARVSEEEIRSNAALLKSTLASFGIEGEVSEVHPGPIITRYEFTPGVGVTISQIVSRQDDMALAMRAPRVRLLAPIPGKAAIGVEIPNREPALISFKEVADTRVFREAKEPLAVALGKDVSGRPFYASLEKMPHLLVAGTTGSGKSVCLNTLIVSLLMRRTPEELRLLLIDPKMLELTMYNDIPHLLRPVVTADREAAKALRWLTREMERRYRILAGVGVRNIQGFEKRRQQAGDPELAPMPYVVVVVDELADLMLSNQSEIEVPIARLAQMARAVGIHLVLATQRPSVDVITGLIKANFPARIAFQVATRTDSRTVLDMNGAESLLGRGDMLFIPPGKAQAHRIHGAFIGDAEVERIAGFLRQFPPPDPIISPEEDAGGLDGDGEEMEDPLFREALRIVVAGQQGSTSLLQRRLRIGYTRAGRLMDMLEHAGIVGPPDGSRAREVLVPPQYLEAEEATKPAALSRG